MKFNHQFNLDYKGTKNGEVNSEKSMTVPNQTIPLRKLLLNHTRGIPSNVSYIKGQYFDTEIPKEMDLVDRMEMAERLEEERKEVAKNVRKDVQQAEEMRREKRKKIEQEERQKIAEEIRRKSE